MPLTDASRAISATDVARYPSRPKRSMAASRMARRVSSPLLRVARARAGEVAPADGSIDVVGPSTVLAMHVTIDQN